MRRYPYFFIAGFSLYALAIVLIFLAAPPIAIFFLTAAGTLLWTWEFKQ